MAITSYIKSSNKDLLFVYITLYLYILRNLIRTIDILILHFIELHNSERIGQWLADHVRTKKLLLSKFSIVNWLHFSSFDVIHLFQFERFALHASNTQSQLRDLQRAEKSAITNSSYNLIVERMYRDIVKWSIWGNTLLSWILCQFYQPKKRDMRHMQPDRD